MSTTETTRAKGHDWRPLLNGFGDVEEVLTRVHRVVAYDGPGEIIERSPEWRLPVCICERCGLVTTWWYWCPDPKVGQQRLAHAYGADVDSLTAMGSAPRCDPQAFSRHAA